MQFYNIINGERRSSTENQQSTDPRNGNTLWDVPIATASDLDEAVRAARDAFEEWSQSTIDERVDVIKNIIQVFGENKEELMHVLMRETGKSRLLAEIEIASSCRQMAFYTKTYLSDEVSFEDESVKILATHTPLGVIGAICPWNFPLILSTIKIVQSLITGNCIIIKPSPFAPYSTIKAIELCHHLLPAGVLQAVSGGADLGKAMTQHPDIAKISFTGTIATGKKIMESCAATLKRMTLELAGNDAAIVCEDVNIQKVAADMARGCFFNAGQMCVAAKRAYVHESIYDEFLKAFVAEVEGSYMPTDDAMSPSVFGPLSNKTQLDVVQAILQDCKQKGFNIVSGGEAADSNGYWMRPTIVAKPPEDSILVQEEQFGPIIPVLSWSDEKDVLKRANIANGGLGAAVYCADSDRAGQLARRLEAGIVSINKPGIPHHGGFMGGQKQSGLGGEMGKQGLLSYCYTKSLYFHK